MDHHPHNCLVLLVEPFTSCTRAPGKMRQSQRRCIYCAGQELITIAPYHLGNCLLLDGERISVSCPFLPDRPVPVMMGCSSSSQSPQTLCYSSTSSPPPRALSQSRRSCSTASAGLGAGHSLQLGTWVTECSHWALRGRMRPLWWVQSLEGI